MRHLGSLALALVVAPIALLLAGRGLTGLPEAATADRTDYFGIAAAGSAVVLAALLYALITMAQFSPLGPTLAGAGYLALGIWALADPPGFLATVPGNLGLTDEQLTGTATLALLLAVPLLVTMFSPGRWRGKGRAAAEPYQPPYQPSYRPSYQPTHTLDDIPRVPVAMPLPAPASLSSPVPPPATSPLVRPPEEQTIVLPSDETTTSLRPARPPGTVTGR